MLSQRTPARLPLLCLFPLHVTVVARQSFKHVSVLSVLQMCILRVKEYGVSELCTAYKSRPMYKSVQKRVLLPQAFVLSFILFVII